MAEPCIKLRGPRTEARFGLAWPVPTPHDVLVDSADALLFQFALSNDFYKLATTKSDSLLIRKFWGSYGGYIPSAALRHSILAFAASYLPETFKRQRIEHTLKASQELRKQNVYTIEDSHLLTAYLLSNQSKLPAEERLIHSKGLIAIIDVLHSPVNGNTIGSDHLACFRPYFLEMVLPGGVCAFLDTTNSMQLCQSISTPFATWEDRVHLQRMLSEIPTQSWNKGTAFEILFWDLCDIFSLIELFRERANLRVLRWSLCLDKLLERWRRDVDSSECRELAMRLEAAIDNNRPFRDDSLFKDACILCLAVKLLVHLLEGPKILEALRSPEAVSLSWMLVSFIRLHKGKMKWGRRQATALQVVFLGGLALNPSTLPNSYPKLDTNN